MSEHEFDQPYWDEHWRRAGDGRQAAPNPYVLAELSELVPGTALDAGCGEGAEAIWLAGRGWQVTAADISAEVLARAAERSSAVTWLEADLGVWEPGEAFDLVTTHYAHPAMPQLGFYARIAAWVAPGGTLLIVGHLRDAATGHDTGHDTGHGHGHPPEGVSGTAESIAAILDPARWEVVTAEERTRSRQHDVVVRARRRD